MNLGIFTADFRCYGCYPTLKIIISASLQAGHNDYELPVTGIFSVKMLFTCAPRDASVLEESAGGELLHRSVSCDEAVPEGGHHVNVAWPQLVHRIRRTARTHLHIMARQLHPLGKQLLAACSAH
jgi:hypothetical protein